MWGLTSYTVDSPRPLWAEFKETASHNDNLNDVLVRMIARRVRDEREELDPEVQAIIDEVLVDE